MVCIRLCYGIDPGSALYQPYAFHPSGMALAGGEREWNTMWNLYLNETDAQERTKLLHGLAYSSQPWILQRSGEMSKQFKGISLPIPLLNIISVSALELSVQLVQAKVSHYSVVGTTGCSYSYPSEALGLQHCEINSSLAVKSQLWNKRSACPKCTL